MRNHKKCFSFISRPILIVIALFGRAELRTLNFYTEFWNFAPLINYGNFMQIYSKNNKNCFFSHISWPIFILFILSDRARWVLQNLYTKLRNSLIMLSYANLFKITNKITKNASSSFLNRFWFSLLYLGRAKLGTLNFYTEFWDFAPLINYGNLCKFIPKIKKIASSPSFLDRFSFCLFCLIGLGEGFKTCTQNFEIH